ncbi:MAG: hypothetical protein ACYC7F_00845 [Gemmatimonadaceae bacterium]
MELLTPLLLIAIAALLFYRWVSPAHKRLTGKVVLAIASLLGIVGGGVRTVKWRRDVRARADSVATKAFFDSVAVVEDKRMGSLRVRVSSLRGNDLTVEICNQDSLSVDETEFLGWGLVRGHSTEYLLLPTYANNSGRSVLTTDVVVPPRSCETHAVRIRSGLDSAHVVPLRARFADGSVAKGRFYDLAVAFANRP